jgi:hypothetical protein
LVAIGYGVVEGSEGHVGALATQTGALGTFEARHGDAKAIKTKTLITRKLRRLAFKVDTFGEESTIFGRGGRHLCPTKGQRTV